MSESKSSSNAITAVRELQELFQTVWEHPVTQDLITKGNDSFDLLKGQSRQQFDQKIRPLLNSDLPKVSPFLQLLNS